ncbi:MAG: hydroxylase [Actinomycetota bacterium]|jgi:alkylation response protein AidB-like acyl-CoA dehydrogenase|nr:hydroxylase [Actinomycetota bacterium]
MSNADGQRILQAVGESRPDFAARATEGEQIGRLPDQSAQLLRDLGIIRMLQPPEHGGYACDPCDFFEAVMAVASADPAAGWVAGVIGVHPWEMVFNDPKVQQEVWGQDPDTWVASPYAPMGVATVVEGGYRFTGRWSFSSGTDHCDWVVLGGFVEGRVAENGFPTMYHILLPRQDYEIDHDSWDTLGLRGTGSKDVIVDNAFVPEHRALDATGVLDGSMAKELDRDEALFSMPWSAIFPVAITSAVIGICEGALAAHIDYQGSRVSFGRKASKDPFQMSAIGEAASEIHASRSQILMNTKSLFDQVSLGKEISWEQRATARRDQVRAGWRAVEAVDEIFTRSGGNATRSASPIAKIYRDAHTALNHAIFAHGPTYQAAALAMMGEPPGNPVALLI